MAILLRRQHADPWHPATPSYTAVFHSSDQASTLGEHLTVADDGFLVRGLLRL